jgi:hypothetical protein
MESEKAIINRLELASELAHRMLVMEWKDRSESMFNDPKAGITEYSDDAQEIFNHHYDTILEIIEDIRYDAA